MLKLIQAQGLMVLLALTFVHRGAHAYDEDTHFYGTYAMARYSGIRPEIAAKIALAAQWMDESYISDPMSMLLLPVTGVQKRRLLHFPSSRVGGRLVAGIQDESLGFQEFTGIRAQVAKKVMDYCAFDGELNQLLVHTQTEPNHEFASALLMQGLKEGNLMKAAASLHVIEDSYAHAGTAAEEGHTFLWHWPDRPYDAVDKYFQMTETVFKALVAIRAQLPEEALDCAVTLSAGAEPNCRQSASQLYAAYAQTPELRQTVSFSPLMDFGYIREVLQSFIARAQAAGYLIVQAGVDFNAELDKLLQEEMFFQGKMDSYQVLELYIRRLATAPRPLLDVAKIAQDMGMLSDPQITLADYIKDYARIGGPEADPTGLNPFLHVMVRRILIGYVPFPLSVDHREELEDDSALPRHLEMDMRVAGMRKLIRDLFDDRIEFVGNDSKDDIGFAHEVLMEAQAEPVYPTPESGVQYVTFSLAEKNRFDQTVFSYLFPSLKPADLTTITTAIRNMKTAHMPTVWSHYTEVRNQIANSNRGFLSRFWQIAMTVPLETGALLAAPFRETEQVRVLYPLAKPFCHDTISAHLRPNGDELSYQNAENFEAIKAAHKDLYPRFLGPNDVWHQSDLLNAQQQHLEVKL